MLWVTDQRLIWNDEYAGLGLLDPEVKWVYEDPQTGKTMELKILTYLVKQCCWQSILKVKRQAEAKPK